MRERTRGGRHRYPVAIAVAVAVAALRLQLAPVLGDFSPFLPFTFAVVVAAWYGGLGPGVLVTALSTPVGFYLLAASRGVLALGIPEATSVALFVFIGVTVSWLCGRLHRARRLLEAEHAGLRGSSEFHAAIAELSADFGYDVRLTPEGTAQLEGVTGGFLRVLGWDLDALNAAGGWSRLVHPDDVPRFSSLGALPASADRIEGETRMLTRDGRVVWIHYSNRLVMDESGQLVGLIGAARDVTARKLAEEALRSSEERYRSLVSATAAVVWTTDATGDFVEPQASWERYTGQPWEQHRGWGWLEALHPDDREELRRVQVDALATHSPFEATARLWHAASGSFRYCEARGVPLFERDGRLREWIGTCTDVEDRRRAEEALRESDRRKDEFLAILAHELRNPLAPLRNALAVLEQAGDDRSLSARVRPMMERQLAVLVRLVDDLLDVSRITRGRLELRRERVEVKVVLEQAVETVRSVLDAAGHELAVTTPAETLVVDADPVRLAQVIANLLHNACKFTPAGGRIWLRVERLSDTLSLTVKDNGAGIAPELLPRVFDLFAQLDTSLERTSGGLGIGLSLAQRLVELHGGSLEAFSEGPGKGSEFVVRLPLLAADDAAAPAHEPADEPRPAAAPRRVLVVDDNRDAAESLALLLRRRGNETSIASDGAEALAAVERFRPNAVLLDIGLPGLNGYDVARSIRRLPFGHELLLVAVTGWGQAEDRRRSEQAGFDAHLVKPLDPATLEELLASRDAC